MMTQAASRLATGLLLLIAALACGCSHQARRVDCDGRLDPINPPTPKAKQAPEAAKPTGSKEPTAP